MLDIICEIANGYYGNLQISKKYIDIAARAKSNAVKFQIAYADDMLQKRDKIFKIIKKNEMSFSTWSKIRKYAKKNKIKFYLDIDGEKALDIAKKIKPDAVKIHTTSFFDQRLLLNALAYFKYIYISISGIKDVEIKKVYSLIKRKKFQKKVTFLYGHQNVPTKIEETNLSRLIYLKEKYKNIKFGFMDHIDGSSDYKYSLSVFALGLGINCFEKHLTFSRKKKLIDSTSALEEKEFVNYIKILNDHKKSLGKFKKNLTDSEIKYRNNALTVIHSKVKIKRDQKIKYSLITHKRPLKFSKKYFYDPEKILGKKSKVDININQPILVNQIK